MTTGSVSEISLKTGNSTIVLIPTGPKAFLTALTETDAQIGLILFEMECQAKHAENIFINNKGEKLVIQFTPTLVS